MPYKQNEEPVFFCPECGKEFSLNDPKVQYGLYADGKLLRCGTCFEKMKHDFWLRMAVEQ